MEGDRPTSDHGRIGSDLERLRAPLTTYFRRRIREADDVADLVQEVFLRLASRPAGEDIHNLDAFVFQIAANVLKDRHRRRLVRHADDHVELPADHLDGGQAYPDEILIARERLKAVADAIGRLPERTRTIFVLRRLEGWAYRDIAERLGVSVSAVEKHMTRAVEMVAKIGAKR